MAPKGLMAANCYKAPQSADHGTCNPDDRFEQCDIWALSNAGLPNPSLDWDVIPPFAVGDIVRPWYMAGEAAVPTMDTQGCGDHNHDRA